MRSVKKLAADLATLNERIARLNLNKEEPQVKVAIRLYNYAKCELERRLSTDDPAEANDVAKLKLALETATRCVSILNMDIEDLNKCQTNWLQQISDLKADNAALNEQVAILTKRISEGDVLVGRLSSLKQLVLPGLPRLLLDFAGAEQKAEQLLSPERRLEKQFCEMPPHIRIPIEEMEFDLVTLHGKRVAEFEETSRKYLLFKCPASELTGAFTALCDIRMRLKTFAELSEEYKAARSASSEATVDYRGGKIALAVLDGARKRLAKVVKALEALCEGAEEGKTNSPNYHR